MNKKYAVCVGNNFTNTNIELSGCVNDANDMGEFLARNGYEVTVIHEATRDQYLAALEDGVAKLKFGDDFIHTVSTHGTWVPDADGDEADRRDECLVMVDYMQNGLVSDDDIYKLFRKAKKGSNRLILSDSCHSGSNNRFLAPIPTATAPEGEQIKPRFIPPWTFMSLNQNKAMDMEQDLPIREPKPSASLISGCADEEYSYDAWFYSEAGWRANGAFTRAAIDSYSDDMSLKQWYDAIREVLPGNGYEQTPQISTLSSYRLRTKAL